MGKLKLVLIGGTERAYKTLSAVLREKINVLDIGLCIFMPGHKDERAACNKMVELATVYKLPYVVCDEITAEKLVQLKTIAPATMIGLGIWRSLISDEVLKVPKYGYIGLHGTPLPRLRGFAGIYWQIINGEKTIQTRFYRLDPGIDSGPYVCDNDGNVLEYRFSIDNEDHLQEILDNYDAMHINANLELIERLVKKDFSFEKQPEKSATYACHRGVDDAEINWNDQTKKVFNFIRAQSKPCCGAYTFIDNEKIIIWRARPRYDYKNYEGRIPGKVASRFTDSNSVVILTADGGIEILECSQRGIMVPPIKIFKSIRYKCQSAVEAKINVIMDKLGVVV